MAIIRARQLNEIQPAVPEIGRIYKGGPKRPGKKPGSMIFGEDLDHFRFEPSERTKALPYGKGTLYDYLTQQWESMKDVTGEWRSLRIRFPFNRLEDVFHATNRKWSQIGDRQTCVRECNGHTCTKMINSVNGKPVVQRGTWACSMSDDDLECPEGCKAEGMLKFMLPDLGYPGMIILTTRSGKDVKEFLRNLLPYADMNLASIPFRLFRSLDDCDRHLPDGTVQRQKKWLCHLEIDAEFGMLQMQGRERQYRAQLSGQPVQALPAAPALALPPSATNTDQQWFDFTAEVQACIQGRSHRPLMQVIEDALNTFPDDWHGKIYAEHDRAASVIGNMNMPVTVAEVPDTAKENLERLSNIRLLTGYSKVQAKAIAESISLVIADCTNWTAQQIEAFRDAVFVDWAKKQKADFGSELTPEGAIAKLKDATSNDDEKLWFEWKQRIEFILENPVRQPEAQPVEATLV